MVDSGSCGSLAEHSRGGVIDCCTGSALVVYWEGSAWRRCLNKEMEFWQYETATAFTSIAQLKVLLRPS